MTFYVENETEAVFDFDIGKTAEQVIRTACQQENCPYEVQVSLTITNEEGIRALNREFREIDSPTDVLSFPAIDYERPGDFSKVGQNEAACMDPESGELVLGDIVLCEQRIRSQAAEYGHSEKREFSFLLAHSMMHLFGYDHMTKQEEALMCERQEAVLAALGIGR